MGKMRTETPNADEIAKVASQGEDVSSYFTKTFAVVKPVHRVSVDLTYGMLRKLDERAARLNISRQEVIETLLGRALRERRSRGREGRADRAAEFPSS